jgi:hypothetical protein
MTVACQVSIIINCKRYISINSVYNGLQLAIDKGFQLAVYEELAIGWGMSQGFE